MSRSVRINDGASNAPLIPEELGKLKVNVLDGNGNHVTLDVKELYAKTSSAATTADLVWQVQSGNQTTNTTTNDTGPVCGVCNNQPVYYPSIVANSTRWNCEQWKSTSKIESLINSTPITSNADYEIYTLKTGVPDFCPPPPGYILGEFATYNVKDSIVVYIRRQPISYAGKTHVLPLEEADPFNPSNICFAACDSNACYSSGIHIDQVGGTPTCVTLSNEQLLQQFPENILFSSGCIATTGPAGSCTNFCYSVPDPVSGYHCRDVQSILPNVYSTLLDPDVTGNTGFNDVPRFANDNSMMISYSDIGLLLKSGCDSGAMSAWKLRLFLPFYVSLPAHRGKYIKVNRETLITNTETDSILVAIRNIFNGTTKAASFVVTEYDSDSDGKLDTIFWGQTGYPKELTHTHMMVVEIDNPTMNNCGVCFNNGGTGGSAQYVRFMPITARDTSNFSSPFGAYVKQNINKTGNLYGIPSINGLEISNGLGYNTYYFENTKTGDSDVPNKLSYQLFLNAYHQSQINSGTYGIFNCNCLTV